MKKIKTIASVLTLGLLITGCANNGLYKSEQNVTKSFMDSIKNYDYEKYMNSITDDLADSTNIILDSETDTENIALYGNKIEGTTFDKMYASILGGIIQGYEYKSSEKTEKTSFKETTDETKKEETKTTAENKESETESNKTEETNNNTAKDTKKDENIEGYYLVKGIVKVPTVESIKSDGSTIFNKNIDTIFNKKLTTKDSATKTMIEFFTKGFSDVYNSCNKEEKDVQFIVVKYKDGTFKINDSDFFETLYSVYSYANEAIGNSDLYSNKNAYDAYLRISLTDEEYKKQSSSESGTSTNTDDKTSNEDSKNDNSSTSWKNKVD